MYTHQKLFDSVDACLKYYSTIRLIKFTNVVQYRQYNALYTLHCTVLYIL